MASNIRWIHPPNWQGEAGGYRRITVHCTFVYDGSDESNAIKVNLSEWITRNRNVPTRTVIERIDWQIHGIEALIEWDRTPDAVIARLNAGVAAVSDSGFLDWTKDGGLVDDGEGGTGDIIITTANGATGDSYDITITLRLKD